MAKGRRERDRPKATPGALYNPNKRVKLSYDSESEGEEQAQSKVEARPEVEDAVEAVAATGDGETEGHPNSVLAEGADALDEQEEDGAEEEAQDEGQEEVVNSKSKLRNAATGQWHALGSLSWQGEGDEEEDGEEASVDSAMEYLRSVRSERQTLPTVLSGPQPRSRVGQSDDYHNFDSDHAFIAAPDSPAQHQASIPDPREAFTEALKKRFSSQSHLLHLPPSSEAVAALTDKQPISYPKSNNKASNEWVRILTTIPPASAQVRSIDEETVYRLLELIQDRCLLRQTDVSRVTSAWIWSLLARLSEVGLMNNDEVYAVRAFGKKAVLVLVSFRSSEAAARLEELADADAEVGAVAVLSEEDADDTGAIHTQATEEYQKETPKDRKAADRENTLATLDSILIIVGDIFGQRDLLEFRQPWEADDGS